MKLKSVMAQVDLIPPSLNVMLRTHWAKRRVIQEQWDWAIKAWLKKCAYKNLNFKGPCGLKATIYFKTKQRRDIDNYIAGLKYCIDALRHCGVIEEDNSDILKVVVVELECDRAWPRTQIEVYKID